MIVGYVDSDSSTFCPACWPERLGAGKYANQVVKDDPDEPNDKFWLVDRCAGCGMEVKNMTVQTLD